MKANVIFSALVIVYLFSISSNLYAQEKSIVLLPKYDTYVTCSSKDTKSSSSEDFLKTLNRTKEASKKLESYIQFHIPRKDFKNRANISSAKFRILESGTGFKGEKEFRVAILTENSWDNTLSGKQRSELKLSSSEVSKTIKNLTKQEGAAEKWFEIDVTEILKRLSEPVVSIRIFNKPQEDDEEALLFYASEVKGKGPELIIEF